MAKLTIDINDNSWPKLQLVINGQDQFGRAVVIDSKERFDLAYTKFENDVHNALRPIVDSVIQFHKRGQ